MEFKYLIYIAIVIGWIVTQWRKKASQPPPSSDSDTVDQPSKGKPMTFEELLREIQESKKPAEVTKPAYSPPPVLPSKPAQPEIVDYDDDIEEEEKDYETQPVNRDERTYQVYEQAKQLAFNRPSLEETVKLEDTEVKFGHFKGYETLERQPLAAAQVIGDLHDPENLKRAFVMSEVLKTKF